MLWYEVRITASSSCSAMIARRPVSLRSISASEKVSGVFDPLWRTLRRSRSAMEALSAKVVIDFSFSFAPPRVCDGREWDCAGSDFAQGFVEGLLGADDRAEADSGGGHEVPAGRQGRIRQPDEQGGHEWGGPAEERVGDVEADREPGVADPCREQLGEEARQGAVVERQHGPEADLDENDDGEASRIEEHEGGHSEDEEADGGDGEHPFAPEPIGGQAGEQDEADIG